MSRRRWATACTLPALAGMALLLCLDADAATLAEHGFERMEGLSHSCIESTANLMLSSTVVKTGKRALAIQFDLPTKKSTVIVRLGMKMDQRPTSMSLWVHGDGSRNLHALRLSDAGGETHYYSLGLIGDRGWQRCVVDLDSWGSKHRSWGGDGNKELDLPIAGVAYDVRSYRAYGPCRPKGFVVVDDLRIESEERDGPDARQPRGLARVAPKSGRVRRYEPFEILVELNADYENPYDPDDVRLRAEFVGPSGKKTFVDGFYIEPYRVTLGRTEGLVRNGDPHWRVRFTPNQVGHYRYTLTLTDRGGKEYPSAAGQFTCDPSEANGFLRVSPRDGHYLEFESGKPFMGLGIGGHMWGNDRPSCIRRCRSWMSDLAAFDGNTMSVTMETVSQGVFSLDALDPLGANYDQENAARLDYVLGMAERRGVYLLVNMFQTALFQPKHWAKSKYNKARGGPCETATEFFSNAEAMRMQQRAIRYMVARWGYSPNVMVWELCNEVNYSQASREQPQLVRDWHREMTAYLRRIDPYGRPLSTCFGSSDAREDPAIWRLPNIDTTIIHIYTNSIVPDLWRRMGTKWQYGKPCIGGESGIPFPTVDRAWEKDPKGLHFHNCLWASVLSGGAGNVLHWWASRYWNPLDLAPQFQPIADFCKDVDWPGQGFERVQLMAAKTGVQGPALTDVQYGTTLAWHKRTMDTFEFSGRGVVSLRPKRHIDDDPRVALDRLPFGLLFGADHAELRQPVTLTFNAPAPTQARLVLAAVARSGTALQVTGPTPKRVSVADADGQDNPYANELREPITLDLPKGRSKWQVGNAGQGWVSIARVEIEKFARTDELDSVVVIGLRGRGVSLLWFYDTRSSWYQESIGKRATPVRDVVARLPVHTRGQYRIEWWDTWRGEVVRRDERTASDAGIRLTPPPFTRDIACKVWAGPVRAR